MSEGHAVAATAGAIFLVAAALAWTLGDKHTPRLILVSILMGTSLLLGSTVGSWIHDGPATWINRVLNKLTGAVLGTSVGWIVFLAAIGAFGYFMWKPQKITAKAALAIGVALAIPFTATFIPGEAGTAVASAVREASQSAGGAVAGLFKEK